MSSLRFITKITRRAYTLLFYLCLPVAFLRLLKHSFKNSAYRHDWQERLGFIIPCKKHTIWIHSVSVGETISAIPLITQLIKQYPTLNIHITTTTPTGREQVIKYFGQQVTYSYIPYDIPSLIKRLTTRLKVILCIVMETEVWPNMLAVCHQQNIPTLLANARLSEKSYHSYARVKGIATDIFNLFSAIAAQNIIDANHYRALGVLPNKIHITGSIKFDRVIPTDIQPKADQLRHDWHLSNRSVMVAASTRASEELFILDAYLAVKKIHPDAFLILIPRHIERTPHITQLCHTKGLTIHYRSQLSTAPITQDILIGDTIGELLLFYALADIAYVGGSLVNTGGHNMLEPAALCKPIITGPYLRNFKAISEALINAQGQLIVHNTAELATTWSRLIKHPRERQSLGKQALAVYNSNQGATEKHLIIIETLLKKGLSMTVTTS